MSTSKLAPVDANRRISLIPGRMLLCGLLAACSALAGCSKEESAHNASLPNGASVKIYVPFKGPGGEVKSEKDGKYAKYILSWKGDSPGKVEVAYDQQHLWVNDHDYGTLGGKDAVVVDARGGVKVSVNGTGRSGK